MKFTNENKILTICIDGTISSINADQITLEITDIRNNNEHDALVIDLSEVSYVSSAGLRLFLSLKKNEADFKIINVNSEVYEVFEMTGFAEIMTVEKAMRVVSIEGKKLIGQGYMGKVFRIDEDTIIKVNYRYNCLEEIKQERELAKKAFVLGVPTAISFDVVKVKEGGYGMMFELIKSASLVDLFVNQPEKYEQLMDLYADLFCRIYDCEDLAGTLPSKRKEALSWVSDLRNYDHIGFSKETLDKMERLISEIPETHNVCHGDLHIKNIMMQGDEPLLIDMETVGAGHQIFELVAVFLTYVGYQEADPGNLINFLGITDEQGIKLFKDLVARVYKDKTPEEHKAIYDKCALLGFMWLAQKTMRNEPENKRRLDGCAREVNALINEIDSLVF